MQINVQRHKSGIESSPRWQHYYQRSLQVVTNLRGYSLINMNNYKEYYRKYLMIRYSTSVFKNALGAQEPRVDPNCLRQVSTPGQVGEACVDGKIL